MLITDCGGGGERGGGGWYGHRCSVWTLPLSRQDILSHLNSFLSPGARVRNVTQKNGKNMYKLYIYQNNAAPRPHIDTCIMQYIVLTPLPPMPPTSTDQNHPTPPHTEIDQVPRRFRKIRGKKLCLTRSQLILIPSTWRKPLRTRDRSNNKLQHCWEASALTTAPKKGSWG